MENYSRKDIGWVEEYFEKKKLKFRFFVFENSDLFGNKILLV